MENSNEASVGIISQSLLVLRRHVPVWLILLINDIESRRYEGIARLEYGNLFRIAELVIPWGEGGGKGKDQRGAQEKRNESKLHTC